MSHEAAIRDHLANERTLLAWQRTALTVVGLGFLVDRFAFETSDQGLSSLLGLGLIALGAALAIVGARRFVATEHQIDTASYRPSVTVHLLVTGAIVIGATMLAAYLYLLPD